MSRNRSAAKLVNMSGKQLFDDIVNFTIDESKMNHIVIKLQIICNPLYDFDLYFEIRLR